MGLKVGDKVRILDVDAILFARKYWKNGDVTEVVSFNDSGRPHLRRKASDTDGLVITQEELHAIERIDDDKKPPKKQRIEALEHEVAALKAEMEALRGAKKPKTANQLRAEVIADAKSFVEYTVNHVYDGKCPELDSFSEFTRSVGHVKVKFVVNKKKRTVVALGCLRYCNDAVTRRATAKCAPDDVFNADIGKAIAVGRLFGLDVERFVNAPKPTEIVVGQRVKTFLCGEVHISGKVESVISEGIRFYRECYEQHGHDYSSTIFTSFDSGDKIIDDTEAQYE